jgi:hypothetical protein
MVEESVEAWMLQISSDLGLKASNLSSGMDRVVLALL